MKYYYLENIELDWLYSGTSITIEMLTKNISSWISIEYLSHEYVRHLLNLSTEIDNIKFITILDTQFKIYITEEDYNLFIVREHPPLEPSSVFKDYRCQSLNSLKSCISHYNLRFNINSSEIEIGYIFRDKFGILFQVVYKWALRNIIVLSYYFYIEIIFHTKLFRGIYVYTRKVFE